MYMLDYKRPDNYIDNINLFVIQNNLSKKDLYSYIKLRTHVKNSWIHVYVIVLYSCLVIIKHSIKARLLAYTNIYATIFNITTYR